MVGYMDDDQGESMQRLHQLTGDNIAYKKLAHQLVRFGVDMPSILEVFDHLQEKAVARCADAV